MVNPGVAESFKRMGGDLRSWNLGEAAPMMAARAALGLALVIVAMLALGLPGWGGAAIIGVWLGGVGMVTPDTRTNPSMPLLIGLVGAAGVLLGAIEHPVLLVAGSAAYALTLTFLGSISNAAGVTLTVSGLVFYLSDHLTEHTGVWTAALAVFAGGAVQALVSLLPPRYRWAHDRMLLAEAWRALADEAE
ncbi:MAG TPA: hypothetical protein VKZ65_13955, partial [Glycomyces sp.]|nr:hypothetical protein [Glycomyces sp.]